MSVVVALGKEDSGMQPHPDFTEYFPEPGVLEQSEEKKRIEYTLHQIFVRAQRDATNDYKKRWPQLLWSQDTLPNHARWLAANYGPNNIDPLNTRKLLTNDIPRFRAFYVVFYLFSYYDNLRHGQLGRLQQNLLNAMDANLLDQVTFQPPDYQWCCSLLASKKSPLEEILLPIENLDISVL